MRPDVPEDPSEPVAPIELEPVGASIAATCDAVETVEIPCPTKLPRSSVGCTPSSGRARLRAEPVKDGDNAVGVNFGYCVPSEQDLALNRPERFLHLVIMDATSSYARPSESWTDLERTEIAGRAGTLYRVGQPSFHGDHFAFRWNRAGGDLLVSLHAWEPIAQARATLVRVIKQLD